MEQKQIDERLKQIYNVQYDDESEIEEEEIDDNILLNNEDDSQENIISNNLVYKSYLKSLIKYIEDNIDEDEEILQIFNR